MNIKICNNCKEILLEYFEECPCCRCKTLSPTHSSNIDRVDFKGLFLNHLRKLDIERVSTLWAYSKDFAQKIDVIIGGSYLSTSDSVSVHLKIDDYNTRFEIKLSEVL